MINKTSLCSHCAREIQNKIIKLVSLLNKTEVKWAIMYSVHTMMQQMSGVREDQLLQTLFHWPFSYCSALLFNLSCMRKKP